jgi:hypothetical protein
MGRSRGHACGRTNRRGRLTDRRTRMLMDTDGHTHTHTHMHARTHTRLHTHLKTSGACRSWLARRWHRMRSPKCLASAAATAAAVAWETRLIRQGRSPRESAGQLDRQRRRALDNSGGARCGSKPKWQRGRRTVRMAACQETGHQASCCRMPTAGCQPQASHHSPADHTFAARRHAGVVPSAAVAAAGAGEVAAAGAGAPLAAGRVECGRKWGEGRHRLAHVHRALLQRLPPATLRIVSWQIGDQMSYSAWQI